MAVILRTVLFICFAFFIIACSADSIEEPKLFETFNDQTLEVQVMDIINKHRESLGLTTLTFNETAYASANDHNDYMILQGILSHDNFNSRASKIVATVHAKAVGENIASGYLSAESVFKGWITSPEHKKTLENDFTHAAVSVKKNTDGEIYYTHIFYK